MFALPMMMYCRAADGFREGTNSMSATVQAHGSATRLGMTGWPSAHLIVCDHHLRVHLRRRHGALLGSVGHIEQSSANLVIGNNVSGRFAGPSA